MVMQKIRLNTWESCIKLQVQFVYQVFNLRREGSDLALKVWELSHGVADVRS